MIATDVAVIGGGFSGCAVAAHLARHAPPGLSLTLFEPGPLGCGAAYGTRHSEHLLNTRARMMSLFADDPDHFTRWLGARAAPNDFVSRQLYGAYVGDCARHAFEHPRFAVVRDRVRRAGRGPEAGYAVRTESDAGYAAATVVLATGNPLPGDGFLPRELGLHPGYVADPWRCDYRRVGGEVLLIGSGLTALDALVALDACGHRGIVHVLSRHGRYPEVHADGLADDVLPALEARDARALLRSFRRHVAEAARRGFDWRTVVDAIRPEADAIWRRLPPAERARFERHLRGRWERGRHRAPEAVDAVRRRYAAAGRLTTRAGRVTSVREGVVSIALREGGLAELRPDWIVNCTGLGGADGYAKEPLVAEMLEAGLLSISPRRQGLQTTWDLAAVGAGGAVTPGLWIVGPPVRGSRFEATAVPELRAMAETAGGEILQWLGREAPARFEAALAKVPARS